MGPCCSVYARRELTEGLLDRIASYLADASRPQVWLPQGREWFIWVFGRPVSVRVERTEVVLWDCEDELLELGLLPESAPFRVILCAGCNSYEDDELLRWVSGGLASMLDGIPTEPTKSSGQERRTWRPGGSARWRAGDRGENGCRRGELVSGRMGLGSFSG